MIRFMYVTLCIVGAMLANTCTLAASVTWSTRNATVWWPVQTLKGTVAGNAIHNLYVHCDEVIHMVPVINHSFSIKILLRDHVNKIWATAKAPTTSDTLILTLGYRPKPEVSPLANVIGNRVLLRALVVSKPYPAALKFHWVASSTNPAPTFIKNRQKNTAEVIIPEQEGIYRYQVKVISGTDTAVYKTYVTRHQDGIKAFNLDKDYASWIDSAIIYEVTPNSFIKHAGFNGITQKLPELKSLGINTLWIQPFYKTPNGGQGYDVSDYLSVRPDYGTETDLEAMIATAKQLQLRILFDFVPNHTSIQHPYAQDVIKYGQQSHYYNFYQHITDNRPYSSFYHKDDQGFISYFWEGMVNLNYNNPEVQQWITEVCKYWLNKYDIDGYRFDAVWGINARTPTFFNKLRRELKSIKPDLLLLAEDKATNPTTFASGFDAAYDWAADTSWVSQWAWQSRFDVKRNLSLFNDKDPLKSSVLLNKRLAASIHKGKVLRFIENNDVPPFIATHSPRQTRMAAALLFALPGIPMLYNGQEVGSKLHPYSSKSIFTSTQSIQAADSNGLFAYYKQLIALRLKHSALLNGSFEPVELLNTVPVVAFYRKSADERILVILNLSSNTVTPRLKMKGPGSPLHFENLLNNQREAAVSVSNEQTEIAIEGHSAQWLIAQ